MKFQSVVEPNGLIANLHVPVEGKRHESGMITDSGLLNQLQQYSFGQDQRPLCIYRDLAYPLRVHLQANFKGARLSQQQVDWNTRMSEVRVSVEWIFGAIITYFKFLDFKKNLKIGLRLIVIDSGFDCQPPTVEEYFV